MPESDTSRDGLLSYAGEWHALAIGATFGLLFHLTAEPAIAAFFAAVLLGKATVDNPHLRDAAREAAYSGSAFVATYGVFVLLL